jgi:nucleoside-diphosphate-sugar epimerase
MAKRVLVTGLNGFIGRHARAPLEARGFDVIGVGRGEPPEDVRGKIAWRHADLLLPGAAKALIDSVRPTHLLHFAWYAEHQKYWRSPQNTAWVRATLELVQAFHDAQGARCVLAGSCAEYDWRHELLSEYATPRIPHTPFGRSKNALFEALDAYAEVSGLSYAWGRIFFVYGPAEHPGRLVAHVIRKLLRGERAATSPGTQRRDFTHVEDIAAAFAALLDSAVAGPINIASGEARPVRDIIELAGELAGRPELLDIGALPLPPTEPACLAADVRRMREELGYQPRIGLREGLARVIDSYRASPA